MDKQEAILVVNAGSSSLKFQVFAIIGDEPERRFRGQISGIGSRPRLDLRDGAGTVLRETSWKPEEMPDLPAAIAEMTDWVRNLDALRLRAIGHRVVHGGPDHADPVRIRSATLDELATFQELAPLHQPNNLAPIRLAMDIAPHLPQIACFDTAFHRAHARHTECYALAPEFYDAGIRRYGFHGLSYEYIARKLQRVAPEVAHGRVIVAHLGSGASMCALLNNESILCTMGFTALDGLPMATRPGQLDPGVVLYMISHMGYSVQQVTDLLYHRSGLLGLSGLSSDMRLLLKSDTAEARLAVDHFVHQCVLHVGMLAAGLGGLDALVFTAGIGENAPEIRQRIADRLGWLGVALDPDANARHATCISTNATTVPLYVLPTDEERIIAEETLALLSRNRRE